MMLLSFLLKEVITEFILAYEQNDAIDIMKNSNLNEKSGSL